MNLKTVLDKGVKHLERKRVGRGIGSGLGKTSGRGHKGWGARSGTSRRPGYEGGQMPIYRRVPKRGFTNARFRVDYTIVNVDVLEELEAGSVVDLETLIAHGLATKLSPLLKVLGNGELTKALTVRAHKFSASAKDKIEKAGGTTETLQAPGHAASAKSGEAQG
jgi:large subunit ribosomal protein L15